MKTLQVATDPPFHRLIHESMNGRLNRGPPSSSHPSDSDMMYSLKKISGSFSPNTLSTCSSWSSSPSSLSLRTSSSVDSSSYATNDRSVTANIATREGCGQPTHAKPQSAGLPSCVNANRKLTSERKRWIENTLLNKQYQPYSTNERDECRKNQNKALATERKRWIEQTLLSKPNVSTDRNSLPPSPSSKLKLDPTLIQGRASSQKKWIEETLLSTSNSLTNSNRYSRQSPQCHELELLQGLSSSVAQRRLWLSTVIHSKTAAELEEEVRQERLALKEEKRRCKEECVCEQVEEAGSETADDASSGNQPFNSLISASAESSLDEEEMDPDTQSSATKTHVQSQLSPENQRHQSQIYCERSPDEVEIRMQKILSYKAQTHLPAEKERHKKKKFFKGFMKKLSPKKPSVS